MRTETTRAGRFRRTLLRSGLAAGPLFVSIFLVEGATRRDGYRPMRHPVSSLALGPRGWVQKANFAITGTLYLAGAVGLDHTRDPATRGAVGPVLIGAAAAGLLADAIFTTDPVSGYPPGTPDAVTEPTAAGIVHDLVAMPVFLGLPLAAAIHSWRFARAGRSGWATYSAATAAGMLAAFGLSAAGFAQSPRFVDRAGLWQRVSVISGFSWLTALTARALRQH